MRTIREIKKQREWSKEERANNSIIGLVPTLGFLHKGHLSLVRKAREVSDSVVVSIFVNPTQFGPGEDYKEYPREEVRDLQLLENEEVDVAFIPSREEMYPEDYETYVAVEKFSKNYCGSSRPGHFRGVTTVVIKLLLIVQPDIAVFGEKDYQQLVIVKRMVRDLNIPVQILSSPIVRERDGLAMSSRNRYLNPEERKNATVLYDSMKEAQQLVNKGMTDVDALKKEMIKIIEGRKHPRVEYIEFVEPETLKRVKKVGVSNRILMAVHIGRTRLIDNMEIRGQVE
ncbi:pantoate--beta-alanine ligase [candidate division WOR-3 bacterium]|nr:pantoate--beta-alanine ligase [candidate division WOR-3 bacterium]